MATQTCVGFLLADVSRMITSDVKMFKLLTIYVADPVPSYRA